MAKRKKLTPEDVKKWIDAGAGPCPFCGGEMDGLEHESPVIENCAAYQRVYCGSCGATWHEGHTLDRILPENDAGEIFDDVDAAEPAKRCSMCGHDGGVTLCVECHDGLKALAGDRGPLLAACKGLVRAWERGEPMHRGDPQSFADPIGQARLAIKQAESDQPAEPEPKYLPATLRGLPVLLVLTNRFDDGVDCRWNVFCRDHREPAGVLTRTLSGDYRYYPLPGLALSLGMTEDFVTFPASEVEFEK